jgi:uncharacterized protein
VLVALAFLLLTVAAAAAVAWRLADGIVVPRPYALMPEFTVIDHDEARRVVRLPVPPAPTSPRRRPQYSRTDASGRYGLLWESAGGEGVGHLGPVTTRGDGWLERPLRVLAGHAPRAGAQARLDVVLHHRDPLADHGIAYEDVRFAGPVGELAAWWIDGGGRDAVVMVHGRRRGSRLEALRALPTAVASGASVLVASYRNHDACCASPSGLYTYGRDEADDLLAALGWLAARGVTRVVVMGFSMGGAVTLLARERWPGEGPRLAGMVLEAPLLDPRAVVRHRLATAGAPAPRLLAWLGLTVAAWRSGVRWRDLDLLRLAPGLDVATLLIAAEEDATIPISLVDAFAAAAPPHRVTYWRVPAAEHVEAFNVDPEGYEGRLRAFLARALSSAG